jgi:hypothetical protein
MKNCFRIRRAASSATALLLANRRQAEFIQPVAVLA